MLELSSNVSSSSWLCPLSLKAVIPTATIIKIPAIFNPFPINFFTFFNLFSFDSLIFTGFIRSESINTVCPLLFPGSSIKTVCESLSSSLYNSCSSSFIVWNRSSGCTESPFSIALACRMPIRTPSISFNGFRESSPFLSDLSNASGGSSPLKHLYQVAHNA